MPGLLVNNYSQRTPPALGDALTGLLGNWGGNIEQGLLSALPVLAENDPYKIGQQLLRDGAGVGGIVWHGSPHKFARPDLSQIGTGEGAQAYGHGFYTAEARGVGEGYRKDLSGYDELVINKPDGDIRGEQLDDIDLEVAKYLEVGAKDAGQFPHNTVYYAKRAAVNKPEVLERLEKYGKAARMGYEKNRGHLYKMNIPDETIGKMLDWDAPMSGQSDIIRDEIDVVIEKVWQHKKDTPLWKGKSKEDFIDSELQTGDDLHSYLEVVAGSDKSASEYLNSLGIPGIKYLDGNSRAAGQGSRNFVSFTPDHIEMLERNGIPMKGLLGE